MSPKNQKLQLSRLHFHLEALYLLVQWLIVPQQENAVCTAVILDFFSHLRNLIKSSSINFVSYDILHALRSRSFQDGLLNR